jgi:5-methylcytosine-specific restriction enzyme subunit McrC
MWSAAMDVGEWLKGIGLGQYEATFREHEIDAEVLPALTDRCGTILDWKIKQKTAGIDQILPTMRTDIVLDHIGSGRRIVIDTKFTSIVTTGWHREETLRSAYVYQIYAYLRSQAGRGDPFADSAGGLLLHPAVGADVDETAVVQGHAIRFATVDLSSSTSSIRSRLLRLCQPVLLDRSP